MGLHVSLLVSSIRISLLVTWQWQLLVVPTKCSIGTWRWVHAAALNSFRIQIFGGPFYP